MKKISTIILLFISLISYSQNDKTKVSCVGNSITYGMTLTDPSTESYPAQLQEMLGERYEVGNFGKSGATLTYRGYRPYVEQEEFQKAMDFAGDIVVIHLGVNDTDPRVWPNYCEDFVKDYLSLIDSLRSGNPDCRVIIARMSPLSHRHYRFESGTRDWHAEIQKAIETIAVVGNTELIDFYEELHKMPHLIPDAIHPNKEGAHILAEIVYSAITGDFGGLKMSDIYSDNMVLPHDKPFIISGTADKDDVVTLKIDGNKYTTTTDYYGKWNVEIQPLDAKKTYTLKVSSKDKTLEYKNIAAGEIWLCSGQSNMEFELRRSEGAEDVIKNAKNKQIRLYDMKVLWRTDEFEWSLTALDSVNDLQYFTTPQWTICNPKTASEFSAIGYHFGKMLNDSLQIPIGLICNAVGGSPVEAWIDRTTMENEFPAILREWNNNDFIQKWVRDRGAKNITLSDNKLQRHPYHPCYLFEASISPLADFAIDGVIWYQGESNAHNKDAHEKLFPMMIESWRDNWNNDALPFYFVQLSSMARPSWDSFRDSQRLLAERLKNVEMVVSSDKGDSLDVHPRQKKEIGERLARQALHYVYGMKDITPSGPIFRSATCQNGIITLTFNYSEGLTTSDGLAPSTFEVAEYDGLFYPAEASIVNDKIQLTCKEVKNPRYVRYALQPFTRANVVNSDNLPASTFKVEVENVER